MKISRKAHSKLNLFLEVTGKKENGYHELHSLAVFLDLADEITVEPSNVVEVHEAGGESGIENNLIFKTAVTLAEDYNIDRGAKITFTKRIPIGGGLGGGSADAAATLVLLNTFWKLNIPRDELFEIALELGADVPVCLYSILENKNAAIFKGIGEVLEPAPAKIPHMHFLLVNPGKELPTADVFKKYKFKKQESAGFNGENFYESLSARRNDLEDTAKKIMPEIGVILSELAQQKNCRLARMTGSGATCFGIFKSARDARNAAKAIMARHPDWRVGPANLKRTSLLSIYERLKRPIIRARVRTSKKIRSYLDNSKYFQMLVRKLESKNISLLRFRSVSQAVMIHIIFILLSLIVFTAREFAPEPRLINITFASNADAERFASLPSIPYNTAVVSAEDSASPNYAPLTELKLATDAAQAARLKAADVEKPAPKVEKPKQQEQKPVEQKIAEPKPEQPEKKAAQKQGSKYGNTEKLAQLEAADYLELLQYTVQEMSQIPNIEGLKGTAILRLEFDRRGYVHAYNLRQKTGVYVLDEAAINVAKKLMKEPFPAAPKDFDKGEEVLKYDFLIKYPPNG